MSRLAVAWSTPDQAWSDAAALASELVGHSIELTHACPHCGASSHGRPVAVGVDDVHVSLSRAAPWAIVAASRRGPVGVDLDASGQEWVRIEAVLKATGQGLRGDPSAPTHLEVAHQLHDIEAPAGFSAALVVLTGSADLSAPEVRVQPGP